MSVLQVQKRVAGKSHHLRQQGLLPMALVTRDHKTSMLQTSMTELKRALAHVDGLGRLDFEIDGEKGVRKAIVRDVDKNYIKGLILHVTLQEISEDDTVKLDIQVIAIGTPEPVTNGQAVLMHSTTHVKLKGKMSDMPQSIEVDISGLEMNGHIGASDLKLPDGVELISSPDASIFSVSALKAEVLEPVVEEGVEGAEPGVVGESAEGASEESKD